MTQKIPCPECAELNYESSPACWKCGATLKRRPPVPPAAETPEPPEPPTAPSPTEPPTPPEPLPEPPGWPGNPAAAAEPDPTLIPPPPSDGPQPSAFSPQPSPKPAELEAAALKEKDFVTPPVDVEEKPGSPGEWLAYAWAGVMASGSAFRESLNEYDARRGRKSGGVSSYGCVMIVLVCAAIAVLAGILVPFLTRAAR